TWRSTQFSVMLSLPPTNHFANGRSHSRVVSNGTFQVTVSRAIFAQNASGSRAASSYRDACAFAWAANAGSGGKVRPSASRFSISGRWATLTGPLLPLIGRAQSDVADGPVHAARRGRRARAGPRR